MFYFILCVVCLSVLYIWRKGHERRERTRWKEASDALGFTYQEPHHWAAYPRLSGAVDGVSVVVDVVFQGVGRYRSALTRARCPAPLKLPAGLKVMRKASYDGIFKVLGAQAIEIGHPATDAKLWIAGQDEAEVRRFFQDPRVREACEDLAWKKENGVLSEQGVEVYAERMLLDTKDLDSLIQEAVESVKALKDAAAAHHQP
jgi:hypothetical protein